MNSNEVLVDQYFEKSKNVSEKSRIWYAILNDVIYITSNVPEIKHIIFLGEEKSGKMSLVDKIINRKNREFSIHHVRQCHSLYYRNINVNDDNSEDCLNQLSIWSLSGHNFSFESLKLVLPKDNLHNCLVIITIDASQPWNIMINLQKWISDLNHYIDSLELDLQYLNQLKDINISTFQSCENSIDTDEINDPLRSLFSFPVAGQSLVMNLPVPIIIAVTKTDMMSNLIKSFDFKDEFFDFIQQSLRRYCLQIGASLIYTSVKEDKNIDILYRFILHILYHSKSFFPGSIIDTDSVFVPAGWDNQNKISILDRNLRLLPCSENFNQVIKRPDFIKPKFTSEARNCDEDQLFFIDVEAKIDAAQKQPDLNRTSNSLISNSKGMDKNSIAKNQKVGNDVEKGNDSVIHQFFSALLQKDLTTNFGNGSLS